MSLVIEADGPAPQEIAPQTVPPRPERGGPVAGKPHLPLLDRVEAVAHGVDDPAHPAAAHPHTLPHPQRSTRHG